VFLKFTFEKIFPKAIKTILIFEFHSSKTPEQVYVMVFTLLTYYRQGQKMDVLFYSTHSTTTWNITKHLTNRKV